VIQTFSIRVFNTEKRCQNRTRLPIYTQHFRLPFIFRILRSLFPSSSAQHLFNPNQIRNDILCVRSRHVFPPQPSIPTTSFCTLLGPISSRLSVYMGHDGWTSEPRKSLALQTIVGRFLTGRNYSLHVLYISLK